MKHRIVKVEFNYNNPFGLAHRSKKRGYRPHIRFKINPTIQTSCSFILPENESIEIGEKKILDIVLLDETLLINQLKPNNIMEIVEGVMLVGEAKIIELRGYWEGKVP